MANTDFGERTKLTRKEAANYITKKHLQISAATLARYAMGGNGPPFCHIAGDAVYEPEDLDAWIASFPKTTNTGGWRKNRNVKRARK